MKMRHKFPIIWNYSKVKHVALVRITFRLKLMKAYIFFVNTWIISKTRSSKGICEIYGQWKLFFCNRYLALESMCHLASTGCGKYIEPAQLNPVINSLKSERDVSVRQRAVDLLYAMCDYQNVKTIVAEMLSYLELADYSIREELVSLSLWEENILKLIKYDFSKKDYSDW